MKKKELSKEAEEAKQIQNEQKIEGYRLTKEAQSDANLRDSLVRMLPIKEQVGELIHDSDFLWFMIGLILTNRVEALQQQRPNSIGYQPNSYTNGIIEAYKRSRDNKHKGTK